MDETIDRLNPTQNVFRLVPKDTTGANAAAPQEDLLAKIHELEQQALTGELQGLAFVGIYAGERFGIGWVAEVPLPHMVGYLEFLQQQMIATCFTNGVELP